MNNETKRLIIIIIILLVSLLMFYLILHFGLQYLIPKVMSTGTFGWGNT